MVDVSFDGDLDNSLKNRTWGLDPETVIENAGAFNRTMREQGVLSCGKHFPGYSRAAVDPHHELPVVKRSRRDLEEVEWKPFRSLAPELDSMMVGHANYPALDESGLPSSLSREIIHGILREEWDYTGAVISDDLDMGAIVGHYGLAESVVRAVEAGNDLVLLCHRPEVVLEAAKALESIPARPRRRSGEPDRAPAREARSPASFLRRGPRGRGSQDLPIARGRPRYGRGRRALGRRRQTVAGRDILNGPRKNP